MFKAVAKGCLLAGFGYLPGGTFAYRWLTRAIMGSQAGHVDKLTRVWPGYAVCWRDLCGLELDRGSTIWVHGAGWTPFPAMLAYLLTGRGGILTNSSGRVLDRYLERSIDGAQGIDLPAHPELDARRRFVRDLGGCGGSREAISRLGGSLLERVDPGRLSLPSNSVDLVHSGGVLEHMHPEELEAFLEECQRIVRPGGVASHVVDHRDHLHHADTGYPFLGHLAVPEPLYQLWSGHRLGYHNRLSPGAYRAILERRGFETIAIRRMTLPRGEYLDDRMVGRGMPGIAPERLIRRHLNWSSLDLRTAAAHYLVRKPVKP